MELLFPETAHDSDLVKADGRSIFAPEIRWVRESDRFEASFTLELSGAEWPSRSAGGGANGKDGRRVAIPPLCQGQRLEVVTAWTPARQECFLRGRAMATTRENAVKSACDLWENTRFLLATSSGAGQFEPVMPARSSDLERRSSWEAECIPGGYEIRGKGSSIGYGAELASGAALVLTGHPNFQLGNNPFIPPVALDGKHGDVQLVARLEAVHLTDRALERIAEAQAALKQGAPVMHFSPTSQPVPDSALLDGLARLLENWHRVGSGVRLTWRLKSSAPLPEALMTMIAQSVYPEQNVTWARGATKTEVSEMPVGIAVDLRNAYPEGQRMPLPLPEISVLRDAGLPKIYPDRHMSVCDEGVLLGQTCQRKTEVRFSPSDRARHCYIVGATGSGKTSLMTSMIVQDMRAGHGLCVIDPHGDLYAELLTAVPAERLRDVVLIDPTDPDRSIGLNYLEYRGERPRLQMNFLTNEMISILDSLYDLGRVGGPMFEQYMRNALQLVMDNEVTGGTLLDAVWLFEDVGYRRYLLDRCRNPYTIAFWRRQAEKAGGETSLENMAPYITSKLNQFTQNEFLRPIIGQEKSTVDFLDCMSNGRIVLVNLSKGILGHKDARMLGMLLMGKLFQAAMLRVTTSQRERRPFMLYVDEAHNLVSEGVAHMLAEARKFGLSLTLANQNMSQLGGRESHGQVRDALLSNAGTLLFFRLGAPDSEKLEVYTNPEFDAQDLRELPDYHVAARLLNRGHPAKPFVFKAMSPESLGVDPYSTMKAEALNTLRETYTMTREEVENRLCQRRSRVMSEEGSQAHA